MQKIIKSISIVMACLSVIYGPVLFGEESAGNGLFPNERVEKNFEFKMPFKMGLFNLNKQIRVMTSFNNFIISFLPGTGPSRIRPLLSGFTEFSAPAGTSVYAIRGGEIESIQNGVISIVEKTRTGIRKWTYSNLEPSSIPSRLLRMIGSRFKVYNGDKIGTVKRWDGVNRSNLKSNNSSNLHILFPTLDHLRLEVRSIDKNGNQRLFDPLPYFGLRDIISPVIKNIYFLWGKHNNLYKTFFSKPVVRGKVKIAINAYDKMNIPGDNRNEIVRSISEPTFKLGIKQASLRIEKVQTSRIIYRSWIRPGNGLNPNNRIQKAEKFYLNSIISSNGLILPKSGKLNRMSFLVLTKDSGKEELGAWNTLEYPNGVYKVIITVSDEFGNKTVRSKEVLVNN